MSRKSINRSSVISAFHQQNFHELTSRCFLINRFQFAREKSTLCKHLAWKAPTFKLQTTMQMRKITNIFLRFLWSTYLLEMSSQGWENIVIIPVIGVEKKPINFIMTSLRQMRASSIVMCSRDPACQNDKPFNVYKLSSLLLNQKST